MNEGLSWSRGQGGIGLTIWWWVDAYSERRWRYLLDGWSGGVENVLYGHFWWLLLIAWLSDGNNGGEFWIEGDGWVLRVVGWCWVSGAHGCCGWPRGRGALRGVEYFGHLVVVNTVEVVTEGGASVLVFEGFGFTLVMSTAFSVSGWWSWWGEGVIVEVPGRRRELIPRGRVVE
jgi:hypothetical protein